MISIGEARWLLRRAMETQGPDFLYAPDSVAVCSYVPMDDTIIDRSDPRTKTGCLIGVALALAGETRQALSECAEIGIYALASKFPDMLDSDTTEYFAVAQGAQDQGRSWGHALASAEWYWYGQQAYYRRRVAA